MNKLLKFADDTKLAGTVSSECEINQVHSDLKQLYDWSVDWQMLFNADKCKVLHFGYKNMSNIYTLGNEVINAENEEKYLGVIVIDTLKPSSQCIAAAKSAKKTLGIIKKIFVNRDSEIISKLYQSLVRPKLEYCVQAWRPYLNKGNDLLEKVQNRATQTRLMTKDRSLSYEERLQRLGHLPYITGDQKTTRRSN